MDDANALWDRLLREPSPAAAGKLADIDVAVPVDGDAMRRGELPGGETGMHFAEPGHHLAFGSMNLNPAVGPPR